MNEFCFGIIPLKMEKTGWKVFLVKHNKGHWGFPKGHPSANETPEQIACREVYEETGLTASRFLQTPPLIEKYRYMLEDTLIEKVVTYFLAEVKGDIRLYKGEISDAKWVTLDDALKLLTFEESRRVCLEAKNLLVGQMSHLEPN